MVQNVCWGHWRSVAVQAVSEPENCHGAGFILLAGERTRVQEPLQICLGSRSKSKKCDKQLTHIVRVICRVNFKTVLMPESCLGRTLSQNKAGWAGMLFCSFWLSDGVERAANVHDSLDKILVNTSYLVISH
jgi:hypothetical protein